MRRARACTAVTVGLLVLVTGCRDDTVQVTFRPDVGDSYRYAIRVETDVHIALEGEPPEERSEVVELEAEHTVLDAGPDGVLVRVVVQAGAESPRVFRVRFDRAAQLESIERVEGVPETALGDLGIPEIFPAAAGAPPDRRLRPGESWRFHELVALPGAPEPGRVEGQGRLVSLGVSGGQDVARVWSHARVLLDHPRTAGGGPGLTGVQETTVDAVHDLRDGAIRRARAEAVGTFAVEVGAPPGTFGDPVPGTVTVEVRSETRRLD